MDSLITGAAFSFWFGILTSISPCPLATNIAAVSFISKHVNGNIAVLLSGSAYTFGRVLAYIGISSIIITGLLSVPDISFFLQQHLNKILGPLLILTSLFLFELIPLPSTTIFSQDTLTKIAASGSLFSSMVLGIIFALSFCPVSAALFFGSLIPIAVTYNSIFFFPMLYGIGTGIPVIAFALIIGFSAQSLGNTFNQIARFEFWARKITGLIFLMTGIYYSLVYIFNMTL